MTNLPIARIAVLVEAIGRAQGRRRQANRELVEEVCDAVLEKVLGSLRARTFTEQGLERYVCRFASYEARELYRRHLSGCTRSGRLWLPLNENQQGSAADILDQLVRAEEEGRVEQALGALSAEQRDALLTYRQDEGGHKVKDLARLWNWAPGKVYYFRAQALQELRERLGIAQEDQHDNN